MGYAQHVGRVGALAVALGVGLAVGGPPTIARADDGTDTTHSDAGQTPSPAPEQHSDDSDRQPRTLAGDDGGAVSEEPHNTAHRRRTLERVGHRPDSTADDPESGEAESAPNAPSRHRLRNRDAVVDRHSLRENRDRSATVDVSIDRTTDDENAVSPAPVPPAAALPAAPVPPTSRTRLVAPRTPADRDVTTTVVAMTSRLTPLVDDGSPDAPSDSLGLLALLATAGRQAGRTTRTRQSENASSVLAAADPNTAPTANPVITNNGRLTATVTGRVNAQDPDGDKLAYLVTSTPKGTVTINSRGSFRYTPTAAARHTAAAADASIADRTDTFTVSVDDNQGHVIEVPITVTIKPANRSPVRAKGLVIETDSITGVVHGRITANDADGDSISYSASTPGNGVVTVNGDGTFTYTPSADARAAARSTWYADTDRFIVTLDDGHGGTAAASVSVTITPANGAPEVGTPALGMPDPRNGSIKGAVNATDPDGDTLRYNGATTPTLGRVTVTRNGSFTYTPTAAARHAAAAGGTAADTFAVTVRDAYGAETVVAVTVAISATNTAPAVRASVNDPDAGTGVVRGTVTVTDADNDTVSFSAPATTDKGSIVVTADGAFVYTPSAVARRAAGTNGAPAATKVDNFAITVDDGHGGVTQVPLSVVVLGAPNRAPGGGNVTVGQPDPVSGTVTGAVGAVDPDGDALSYTGPTTTTKGTVVVNPDGTFAYTPTAAARHAAAAGDAPSTATTDTFVVTAADGFGGSTPFTVSVNVSPEQPSDVNRAPQISGVTVGTPDGTGRVTGAVTATDPDGDGLTFTGPTSSTRGGAVSVGADGSFAYIPSAQLRNAAAQSSGPVTDTFAVTVSDGRGGSATTTVTVTVAPATPDPGSTASVTGFPAGSIIHSSSGYSYQVVHKVDFSSSKFTTGVVIVAPDGTAIVSDFVPGVADLSTSAPPVARQDGSITILTEDFDATGSTSGYLATFSASGAASVHSVRPGIALWSDDGTAYVVSPTQKDVTAFGLTESETAFTVTRVGAGGAVNTFSYDTGEAQYGEPIGMPAVGSDGTLYVAFNNYSDPQRIGDGIYLTSHAAILAVPPSGGAQVYAIGDLTGSALEKGSNARGLAVTSDGTVYLAAWTVKQVSGGDATTYTPMTSVLVMAPGGAQSRFELPGSVATIKSAGRYAVINWVDFDGNAKTSFLDGRGVAASVGGIGNFLAGPDGTVYSLSGDGDNTSLIATSPSGVHTYPLGGATQLDPKFVKFAADGTPFVVVGHQEDGTFAVTVPTVGKTGPEVPLPDDPRALSFQVIGNVALVVSTTAQGTSVVAIDSSGTILGQRSETGDTAQAVGAATIGQDGTLYVSLVTTTVGDDGSPSFESTLWSVNGDDWQSISTTPGAISGLTSTTGDALVMSVVFYSAVGETPVITTTVSMALPAVSPVPVAVTRTLDRTSGTVSGAATVDQSFGPTTFSGSTTGPLGQVTVNADGTYRFVPSAAARAYAQQLGRVTDAVFFITATNGAGEKMLVPVSVPLIPDSFPTEISNQVDVPLIWWADMYHMYGAQPLGSSVGDALTWDEKAAVLTNGRDAVSEPCTTSNPCDGEQWDYYTMRVTYTGRPPLAPSPYTEQPAFLDVYVISILHLPGEGYSDGWLLGFRKMTPGDSILVKDEMLNPDRVNLDGTVKAPFVTQWAIGVPYGTFPENRFYNRIPGVVGGNMFDNELSPNDYTAIEQDGYDQFMAGYLKDRRSQRTAVQNAGKAAAILGPIAVGPTTTLPGAAAKLGEATIRAVTVRNDKVVTIDDINEYHATYDDQENPMYLAVGGQRSTPPRIGIPD